MEEKKSEELENKNCQKFSSNLYTPIAILLSGIIVAGAVIYSSLDKTNLQKEDSSFSLKNSNNEKLNIKGPEKVMPVTLDDHIYGSYQAELKIIVFSDTECPYCKTFHPVLKRIVDEYQGKVALIYRHFPLDSLHSKARKEAQATECAAEIGGNEKFWAYLDKLFEITPSNDGLNLSKLPEIAQMIGLNKDDFQKCLESNRYAQKIENHLIDAINSGGRGTPYSIVVSSKGEKYPISGAVPYQQLKSIIENFLSR